MTQRITTKQNRSIDVVNPRLNAITPVILSDKASGCVFCLHVSLSPLLSDLNLLFVAFPSLLLVFRYCFPLILFSLHKCMESPDTGVESLA